MRTNYVTTNKNVLTEAEACRAMGCAPAELQDVLNRFAYGYRPGDRLCTYMVTNAMLAKKRHDNALRVVAEARCWA